MKKLMLASLIASLFVVTSCGSSDSENDSVPTPSKPDSSLNLQEIQNIKINENKLIPYDLIDISEIGLNLDINENLYFENEDHIQVPAIIVDNSKIMIPNIGSSNQKLRLVSESGKYKNVSNYINLESNQYDFTISESDLGKPLNSYLRASIDNLETSLVLLEETDTNNGIYQSTIAQKSFLENFLLAVETIQNGEKTSLVKSKYFDGTIEFNLSRNDIILYDQIVLNNTMATQVIETYFDEKKNNNTLTTKSSLKSVNAKISNAPCKAGKFILEKGKKIPLDAWVFNRNSAISNSIDSGVNIAYAFLAPLQSIDEISSTLKLMYPGAAAAVTLVNQATMVLTAITQMTAITSKIALAIASETTDGIDFSENIVEIGGIVAPYVGTNGAKLIMASFEEKLPKLLREILKDPNTSDAVGTFLESQWEIFNYSQNLTKLFDDHPTIYDLIEGFKNKATRYLRNQQVLLTVPQCNIPIPFTGTLTQVGTCEGNGTIQASGVFEPTNQKDNEYNIRIKTGTVKTVIPSLVHSTFSYAEDRGTVQETYKAFVGINETTGGGVFSWSGLVMYDGNWIPGKCSGTYTFKAKYKPLFVKNLN